MAMLCPIIFMLAPAAILCKLAMRPPRTFYMKDAYEFLCSKRVAIHVC